MNNKIKNKSNPVASDHPNSLGDSYDSNVKIEAEQSKIEYELR